ncbi:MAG: hypothetical protein IKU62_08860 [Ruminiclostridium sp.]|nr:hypothetical protein [Ruminiclostridium sp.]
MHELQIVVTGLFLVPLFALLLAWKKPLVEARRRILFLEAVGLVLYILLYAQVDMFGWQVRYWGSVSLLELLSYWLFDQGQALRWVIPALVETGLVLLLEQWLHARRKRARMARFHAIVGGDQPEGETQ